jgi:hypothetical protein
MPLGLSPHGEERETEALQPFLPAFFGFFFA